MATCASCGAENREGARFCDSCGADLGVAASSGREERKVVSILFCDLVGFTAHSERADPEDVRARLRPYHDLLRERIEAYGGVVEKFIGDAVMAVFGAPVAHEDDAERAVRAGLAILESLEDLNAADPSLLLEVRIGVNTGEALVSLDARPEQGEGIVTGDVVNTAARNQTAAPVGGVAVGEGTYRTTQRVFEWHELPPVVVKGKRERIALWQPLRPIARFGSDVIRTHTTPFVGRDVEKALLSGLLDRCIRDRTVQLVTVIGEPGVGKSRQVAELLRDVERRPELIRWRQGRCLPYGDGVAFWALGEIVKAHAGILESDPPEVARDKLLAVLPEEGDGAWLAERLLPLAGVEAATSADRGESFAAWRAFLESIAERDPTVLVIEDLHWADDALLDFLEHLVEHASGVPLLVVCTARAELADRAPGWAGGSRNATTITLNPLSEPDTSRLVVELLERLLLPASLQPVITERAGGNPLYAEEVVRLLRDRGPLDDDVSFEDIPLPETVHALVAARLDTLQPEWKALLQDAAVVGKVFWTGAVAALEEATPQEVESGLHELVRRELVRVSRSSSIEGENELAFWHALVRDVAYGQIPRSQRATKHLAAAAWIEAQAGDRVENVADVLAYHLSEALALYEAVGEDALADALRPRLRRALVFSAERALGLDPAGAVSLLERARELPSDDESDRSALIVSLAWAAFNAGGSVREAADQLDAELPVLRAGADPELTAKALSRRSILSRLLGEGKHVALSEEAISILEPAGPSRALVEALTELAGTLAATGEDRVRAVATVDRAEALSEEVGIEFPARALGFRGGARFELGDDGGLQDLDEAFDRLVAEGAARNAGVVMFNRARCYAETEGPQSLARFEEARAFALARGHDQIARFALRALVIMLAEQGRYDDVAELVATHESELERAGDAETACVIRSWLAWSHVQLGDATAEAEVGTLREQAVGEGRAYALLAAAAWANHTLDRAGVREALVGLSGSAAMQTQPGIRRNMASIVRIGARTGQTDLGRQIADEWLASVSGTTRPYIAALVTATQAALAESDGDFELAADLAAFAVEPLAEFLAFPEHGRALLLLGKARVALGDPSAREALVLARDVFAGLGMKPARAEAEAVLKGEVGAEA